MVHTITGYISAVQSGSCGQLTGPSVEREFGVRFSGTDTETSVRQAVISEAVVNCVELGPAEMRGWMIRILPEVSAIRFPAKGEN